MQVFAAGSAAERRWRKDNCGAGTRTPDMRMMIALRADCSLRRPDRGSDRTYPPGPCENIGSSLCKRKQASRLVSPGRTGTGSAQYFRHPTAAPSPPQDFLRPFSPRRPDFLIDQPEQTTMTIENRDPRCFIDVWIRGLKIDPAGRTEIRDTVTTGLAIRVTPNRVKTFVHHTPSPDGKTIRR